MVFAWRLPQKLHYKHPGRTSFALVSVAFATQSLHTYLDQLLWILEEYLVKESNLLEGFLIVNFFWLTLRLKVIMNLYDTRISVYLWKWADLYELNTQSS